MLTDTDIQAMMTAATNRLQITIVYLKKTTGETVQHTGGVVEIDGANGLLWLWDTTMNDHIRKFLLSNVEGLQVLQQPFDSSSAGGFPLKINGQIIVTPM